LFLVSVFLNLPVALTMIDQAAFVFCDSLVAVAIDFSRTQQFGKRVDVPNKAYSKAHPLRIGQLMVRRCVYINFNAHIC